MFDRVFQSNTTQEQVYNACAQKIVKGEKEVLQEAWQPDHMIKHHQILYFLKGQLIDWVMQLNCFCHAYSHFFWHGIKS